MAKQANNILLIYRLFLEMISSRTFIAHKYQIPSQLSPGISR